MKNAINRLRSSIKLRAGVLRIPSLKRFLIDLNQDIDKLCNASIAWDNDMPISDVEFYVLIIEDRRFFHHLGWDVAATIREIIKMISFQKFGGASTIEMQFVRTVIAQYDRTSGRKIYEILLSLIIRFHIRKILILRSYLRIAYFGTGIRGVDEACLKIYGTSANAVLKENAAIVASLLVSPMPSEPSQEWVNRVKKRAQRALVQGTRFEKRFQKIGVR